MAASRSDGKATTSSGRPASHLRNRPGALKDEPDQKRKRLNPKQLRALNALQAGHTKAEAARIAEVGESTLYRWIQKNPVFRERLQAGLSELRTAARPQVQSVFRSAIDSIRPVILDGVPPMPRLPRGKGKGGPTKRQLADYNRELVRWRRKVEVWQFAVAQATRAARPFILDDHDAGEVDGGTIDVMRGWRARWVDPSLEVRPTAIQRAAITCVARFLMLVAGVQSGKRIRLGEHVRTPAGWTTAGELRRGSQVIGGTGKPSRVLDVFPSDKPLQFFRFTFDDGASVETCDDHLWSVVTPSDRKRGRYDNWSVLTTREIRTRWGHEPASRNRVMIPTCVSEGERQEVPLDPYLVGALIADGSLSQVSVCYTKSDPQIAERVARAVADAGSQLVAVGNGKDYRIRGVAVREHLKGLGLHGKLSYEKRIPRAYLDNDIETRRELLAGLMDGDGSCTKPTERSVGGTTTYCTTSPGLRDDVVELVTSLGGKASWRERRTFYPHGGIYKPGRPSYRVRIRAIVNPFWAERKASRWIRADGSHGKTGRRGTPDGRMLVRVEPTVVEPGVCIAVDDPTRTFVVTKSHIVTHNTLTACLAFWRRVVDEDKPNATYWLVAPDSIVGRVMRRRFREYAPPGWVRSSKGNESSRVWILRNGSRVEFRSGVKPDRLIAQPVDGCWIDEFASCDEAVWKNIRNRLARTNGWCVFSGTPTGAEWAREELWRRGDEHDDKHDPEFRGFHWHTADNPAVPAEEVAAAKATLPEAWYRREWEASWDAFEGQIYEAWNRQTMVRDFNLGRLPTSGVVVAGVDWGFSAPGCIEVGHRLPSGSWRVIDEVYARGKSRGWWRNEASRLREKWGVERFWCDPEDAEAISRWRRAGLPARSAINKLHRGILEVAKTIYQDLLVVHKQVVHLPKQLGSYVWKKDSRGNWTELPVKSNDHAVDACRYMIRSENDWAHRGSGSAVMSAAGSNQA